MASKNKYYIFLLIFLSSCNFNGYHIIKLDQYHINDGFFIGTRPNLIYPKTFIVGNFDGGYKVVISKIGIWKKDLKIGLLDMNDNGKFNDLLLDRIFITNSTESSEVFRLNYPYSFTVSEHIFLKIDKDYYKIDNITDSGESLGIQKIKEIKHDSINIKCILSSENDITLSTLNGNVILLNSLFEKSKYLILSNWFAGCPGCIAKFPKLNKLSERKDIRVVGLNSIDKVQKIQDICKKHSLNFDQYIINSSDLKALGHLGNYPSLIIFDKKGRKILINGSIDYFDHH